MTNRLQTPGLSGGALKLLALITMFIDHIGEMFAPLGAPLWLRYIGRLSAPIFFVMFVEGFIHTHDRKKYFLRIYAVATGMALIRVLVPLFYTRSDGWFPTNGIFSTFAVLVLMLSGIELLKEKRAIGFVPLLLPLAVAPLFSLLPQNALPMELLRCFLPDAALCEGGYTWVLFGLLMVALRQSRPAQLLGLAAFFLLTEGLDVVQYVRAVAPAGGFWQFLKSAALYTNYQWMAAFAALPLAFYNGRRGRAPGRLFYWFYPAHIYLLYALSCVLY